MNKEDIATIKELILNILDDLNKEKLDIHKLNRDLKNISAIVKNQANYENMQLNCEFSAMLRRMKRKS